MRERVETFRHSDEMHGLLRRHRNQQPARVRQTDVFGSQDHQPARDEERVFARVEHAREPIDRRIRIAAANRLDEGADDVVVVLALLVVGDHAALQRVGDQRAVDVARAVRVGRGRSRGVLERVERDARVAVGQPDQRFERFIVDLDLLRAEAAFRVGERAAHEARDLFVVEGVQHEDARAREQRRVDFERRVLRRRADQRDRAVLHVRQDGVLLRFVEAMNFVDEQHGAFPERASRLRLGDDRAQIGHARADGRECDELGARRFARRSRRASSCRCRADPKGSSTGRYRSRSRGAARGLARRDALAPRIRRGCAAACERRAAPGRRSRRG